MVTIKVSYNSSDGNHETYVGSNGIKTVITKYVLPITYTGDGTNKNQNTYEYTFQTDSTIAVKINGMPAQCDMWCYVYFTQNQGSAVIRTKGGSVNNRDWIDYNLTNTNDDFQVYIWNTMCNIRGGVMIEVAETGKNWN